MISAPKSSASKPSAGPDLWVLAFVLLTAGPALAGLLFSALYSLGGMGLLTEGWTLMHWRNVLGGGEFWSALAFGFALTVITLMLSVSAALLLVLSLGSRLRRGALGFLIYLPLAVPGTVAALLAYQVLGDAGLLSRVAHALGWVAAPSDFPSLVFDRWGVGIVLTHCAMITPFFVLLFDRLYENEKLADFLQLASTFGASRVQGLRRIVLPLLARRAVPTLAVYGVVLMGAFEVPLLIGAPYPAMISVTIQRRFGLYDLASKPEAHAMATLYLLLAMAGGAALTRFRRRASV
ncbi:MAG: hypothetical protein ACT4PZ_03170 [Panacagrimonas sp.]